MNRERNHARWRVAAAWSLVLGAAFTITACVYRPNIQQGNLLELEDVEQVQTGMTRSQVRYVLGTPMLADPFDPQRWDYIYTFQRGRESNVERAHFVVHFDGDRVSRIEKLDLPDDVKAQNRKKSGDAVEGSVREPPSPPPTEQRSPDTPRPGSDG